MQIFVHRNGQQLGPFTETELKAQVAAGTVSRQDLVWWEGQAGWTPLGQSSLAAHLTATQPAAVLTPIAGPPPVTNIAGGERTSGMAIGALICGVAGLLLPLICIAALVLGHLSLGEIKRNPGLRGRGMAIAGLVMGYIWPGVFLVIVVISVILAFGQTVHGVFSTINSQLQQAQSS